MISFACPKCGSDILKILKKKSEGQFNLTFVCLNCGHQYKPDEAKQKYAPGSEEHNAHSAFDNQILKIFSEKGRIEAIRFCKKERNWDLKSSKNYVDSLAVENGFPKPKEGCFIATACYGDYNAHEVLILRHYRDNILNKSFGGRIFIGFYYIISPFFASLIRKSDRLKNIIRKHFLTPIIRKISRFSSENMTIK